MAMLTVMIGGYGCGAASERPAPAGDGEIVALPNAAGVVESLRTGACATEGETVTCVVETGRAGSVLNCFRGTQTCTDASWSTCAEADASE